MLNSQVFCLALLSALAFDEALHSLGQTRAKGRRLHGNARDAALAEPFVLQIQVLLELLLGQAFQCALVFDQVRSHFSFELFGGSLEGKFLGFVEERKEFLGLVLFLEDLQEHFDLVFARELLDFSGDFG